ncbi:MAG TPA: DNA glycosylase [Anaerovoracaceae bacterium]|nr:DNA glycosylase [Anaerovoracaceae bacterium]
MQKTVHYKVKDIELKHIFECGQCFRWHENADSSYTGVVENVVANVLLENNNLIIEATGEYDWNEYFDLNRDYGLIKNELIKKDKVIKEAIEYGYGIRILKQDLWEVIVSFLISQNNNIPRIKGCIEKLSKLYGEKITGEYYTFPRPEVIAKLDVCDLDSVKLGYRAKYLIETAKLYEEKKFNSSMEAYEWLLELKGIGPKVANCIMLFGLGYYDSYPIDVWVRKVMKELYGAEGDESIKKLALERFGDYGGFAQQYLFYYMRDKKGKM